jgi:hypothetical protein
LEFEQEVSLVRQRLRSRWMTTDDGVRHCPSAAGELIGFPHLPATASSCIQFEFFKE